MVKCLFSMPQSSAAIDDHVPDYNLAVVNERMKRTLPLVGTLPVTLTQDSWGVPLCFGCHVFGSMVILYSLHWICQDYISRILADHESLI
jgi:hypothetical protein